MSKASSILAFILTFLVGIGFAILSVFYWNNLGFADAGTFLGYYLTFFVTFVCIVWGIIAWNKEN